MGGTEGGGMRVVGSRESLSCAGGPPRALLAVFGSTNFLRTFQTAAKTIGALITNIFPIRSGSDPRARVAWGEIGSGGGGRRTRAWLGSGLVCDGSWLGAQLSCRILKWPLR